ncbi:RagB/SusD family nutrient uptake outer membrane protein [Hufsiella ginkgonis]|uniref:RagB/SusD family nutrient uptake outer membrane protein n=1 Tax=Hufsiella ginkgonis TaxID=2695274 RepID=A0A7K1XWN2_9SPHI|nr:RagB/SusD family nutrient uptake outer membrane protein [Hufsiella ginkgonis]MXV15391.1 RagB/SusD family nutrient uptake outer membrane protein [Hufsiella ginkgonis]
MITLNKYAKTILLAGALAFTAVSCKDTISVDPVDQIPADDALSTKEGIDAAITSIYATLKTEVMYGNRMVMLGDALSDNGQGTNKGGRYLSESRNTRGAHYSQWSTAYVVLNRINRALEAAPLLNPPVVTQAQKDAWVGELKFLRALYHFDLVRTYAYIPGAVVAAQDKGGVPISDKSTKTAEEALNFSSPRATIKQVYDFIYADLDDAVAKLASMTGTTSPAKANKQAAQMLYSRVALYNKDYPKAIQYATDAINVRGTTLLTPANYVNGWSVAVNPESVFEVTSFNTSETLGVNLSLQTNLTTLVARGDRARKGGFGDLVATVDLANALGITVTGSGSATAAITARTADVRNQLFELSATSSSPYYVECTKYLGKGGAINVDNFPLFRIAEAYLVRAEAYYNTPGSEALALADVNKIRTNRGLAVSAATGTALLTEILLQRRVEFAFEGQRFFDLKRLGLDIFKPASNTVVAFTDPVILPAIPQADVDGSKGTIPQNFSY